MSNRNAEPASLQTLRTQWQSLDSEQKTEQLTQFLLQLGQTGIGLHLVCLEGVKQWLDTQIQLTEDIWQEVRQGVEEVRTAEDANSRKRAQLQILQHGQELAKQAAPEFAQVLKHTLAAGQETLDKQLLQPYPWLRSWVSVLAQRIKP